MSRRFFCLVLSKRYLYALTLLLFALVVTGIYGSYPVAMYTISVMNNEIHYDIMLDPGHGGIDPGGIAESLYEKDITLDIVLEIRDILSEHGLKVGLTRETDTDVSHLAKEGTRHRRDLFARFGLMNQARLGMSVHVNSAEDQSMNGAIVFYWRNAYLSKLYAQAVFDEVEKVQVMNHDFVVPRSNLWLLKAKNPVVMVEVGFISNETERAKLEDPQFRANMAQALAKGILGFWDTYQSEQTE